MLRDRLDAVAPLMQRRTVAGEQLESADLIAVALEGADANAQVFQVRDGMLAERHSFYLANEAERDEAEVTEEFIAQYYSAAPAVPRLLVVGPALRDRAPLVADALRARRGGAVEVRVAERGNNRRLRELAARNAALALAQDRLRQERRRSQRVDALSALQDALGLESLPVRIEGFDISNIGGEHTVASMVVFEGGAPKKSDYRRFRIRGDRSAGRGTTSRRSRRCSAAGSPSLLEQADRSPHDTGRDESFAVGPRSGRDRRRQGPAVGGPARPRAADRARQRRDQPREAARGSVRPRIARTRSRSRPTPRRRSCCSGSATRRTALRSTTTAAGAAGR